MSERTKIMISWMVSGSFASLAFHGLSNGEVIPAILSALIALALSFLGNDLMDKREARGRREH